MLMAFVDAEEDRLLQFNLVFQQVDQKNYGELGEVQIGRLVDLLNQKTIKFGVRIDMKHFQGAFNGLAKLSYSKIILMLKNYAVKAGDKVKNYMDFISDLKH